MSFELDEYHEFCNWKTILCETNKGALNKGVATEMARGAMPLTSISETNKVQQFQFQTSGILLFMGVQKLYRPKIS